jgi:hypothetical protein
MPGVDVNTPEQPSSDAPDAARLHRNLSMQSRGPCAPSDLQIRNRRASFDSHTNNVELLGPVLMVENTNSACKSTRTALCFG